MSCYVSEKSVNLNLLLKVEMWSDSGLRETEDCDSRLDSRLEAVPDIGMRSGGSRPFLLLWSCSTVTAVMIRMMMMMTALERLIMRISL